MNAPFVFAKSNKITLLGLSLVLACAISSCKKGGCTDPLNKHYAPFADFDDGSCAPDNKPELTLVDSVVQISGSDSGVIELIASDDHRLAEYSYSISRRGHLVERGEGRLTGKQDERHLMIGVDPSKTIFEGALRSAYYGEYQVEIKVKDVYGKETAKTTRLTLLDDQLPNIEHVGLGRATDFSQIYPTVAVTDLGTILYLNMEVWKVSGTEKIELLHAFDYTVPQNHRNTELNYYHEFAPDPDAIKSGDAIQVFAAVTDANGNRAIKTSEVVHVP